MSEYDRIAGNRIAGMQLAEVEAKRVAALELERIAAQFQGPRPRPTRKLSLRNCGRKSELAICSSTPATFTTSLTERTRVFLHRTTREERHSQELVIQAMLAKGAVLLKASQESQESPGSLVRLWQRELEEAQRAVWRLVDLAGHPYGKADSSDSSSQSKKS
jgi:hypothetical protein